MEVNFPAGGATGDPEEEEPPAAPTNFILEGGSRPPPRRFPRKKDKYKDYILGSLSTESWSSMASSESSSTLEILRRENATLKEQLGELNQCRHASEEKCESLSAEYADVKQKLIETAQYCQQLVMQMEGGKHQGQRSCDSGKLKRENEELHHEREELNKQLEEVILINKKWQRYNDERETYIRGLLKNVEQLKQELQRRSSGHVDEDKQREIDKILLTSKSKITALEEDKEKLEDENRQLRIQNHQKDESKRELEERVRQLETENARGGGRGRDDQGEFIELLQEQVRTVTEDFEAERRDREAAQNKIAGLERDLQRARIQLAESQRGRYGTYYNNPYDRYYQPNHLYGHEFRYCEGQTVVDGPGDLETDGDYNGGYDVTDSHVLSGDVTNETRGDETKEIELHCPRCLRQYSIERQAELTEHIEICCT